MWLPDTCVRRVNTNIHAYIHWFSSFRLLLSHTDNPQYISIPAMDACVYGWPLPNSLIPVPVLDLMSTSLIALLSNKWGIVSHWTLRHKEQHRYVRTLNQPSYLTGSQHTKYKQHSLQQNATWRTTYNWFIGKIQYSLAGQFNLQHSSPCKQLTKTFRSKCLAFEYYQLCIACQVTFH